MFRPPGFLLRDLIAGWPDDRRSKLRRDLGLNAARFETLLLGATPFAENDSAVVAAATGVPAATFRCLEEAFNGWCGSVCGAPQQMIASLQDHRNRITGLACCFRRRRSLGASPPWRSKWQLCRATIWS